MFYWMFSRFKKIWGAFAVDAKIVKPDQTPPDYPAFEISPNEVVIFDGGDVYDITGIQTAINAAPADFASFDVPVEMLAPQLVNHKVHEDMASALTPEQAAAPVILGHVDEAGVHLIDGADRLLRAEQLGIATVGTWVLTLQQMTKFHLGKACPPESDLPVDDGKIAFVDPEPLATQWNKAHPEITTTMKPELFELEFSATNGKKGPPETDEKEEALRDALAVRVVGTYWLLRGLGTDDGDARKFADRFTGRYSFGTLQKRAQTAVPTLLGISARDFNCKNSDLGKDLREKLKNREFRTALELKPGNDFKCERDGLSLLRFEREICCALSAADLRARSLGSGLRTLDAKRRQGVSPTRDEKEGCVFGDPKEQQDQTLPLHEMALVALYGHVDPSLLWPQFRRYRGLFELAIFAGLLLANRSARLSPLAARAFRDHILHHTLELAPDDAKKIKQVEDPATPNDKALLEHLIGVHLMKTRIAYGLDGIPYLARVIERLALRVSEIGCSPDISPGFIRQLAENRAP